MENENTRMVIVFFMGLVLGASISYLITLFFLV